MWKCENVKVWKYGNAKSICILAVCIFACLHAFTACNAAPIPWKLPTYTLVARNMDLRVALDTFAVAEGLSVVMSPAVSGVFSGDFKDVPPTEFLNKIATTHNLIWYYDGAALYLYGSGETATMLIDLQYMKAAEVRSMLAELGVEDARFPLKTTSNDELIMVAGPPRYVSLVAELIAKADRLREKRTYNEVETRIFPLKYTWADDVSFRVSSPESALAIRGIARVLDEIVNDSQNTKARDTASTNEVSAIEAQVQQMFRPVIRAENRLNAVLVRDVVWRMPMYEKLIRELDVPQKLVEIDVTVLELSKEDALDWQLSLAHATSWGHSGTGAGQNAGNLFSPENIAGMGFAGALTHIHSAYSLAASISALKEKGKARSISRTALLTVNNLAAELSDTQSYHAKVVGTEVASLEEVRAGTKLQVKPRIMGSSTTNAPNQVWLSLELDDGGFESITVDAMPMSRSSTLQTQTAVFENESVMLAGYLRDIEEDAGWGIPWLRDIPWIGWIFGGKSTRKETVQRMFILTPHVVDIDQEMVARMQATRLRDVKEAETMEDDADASDNDRKRRDLERADMRERRNEKSAYDLRRRKAELDHEKAMRQIERDRSILMLEDVVHGWKDEEKSEREKFKAEVDAKKAEAEAKQAKDEAKKAEPAKDEPKKEEPKKDEAKKEG